MKWEVRPLEDSSWGVFLMQKFCKTKEPVCYGRATLKSTAESVVERMNSRNWNNETSSLAN